MSHSNVSSRAKVTVCIDALPVTVWFLVLLFFAFLLSSTSKHNDACDYL